jgi:hypothetical protein
VTLSVRDEKMKQTGKESDMLKRIIVFMIASVLCTNLLEAKYVGKKFKEIEAKKPFYLKRKSKGWAKGGRIIGEITNCPETFKIIIKKSGSSKVFYTYEHPAKMSVYMTKILPPGRYDLYFQAEGFHDFKLPNIKIYAKKDCVIKIRFGKRVFQNQG